MEAKDVLALEWTSVKDWSGLTTDYSNMYGDGFVCDVDVRVFVEDTFKRIARKLDIPLVATNDAHYLKREDAYDELKPILMQQNKAFFESKNAIFRAYAGYHKDGIQLVNMEKLLVVPDLSKVGKVVEEDRLKKCLSLYEKLSDVDKVVFLEKIGKVDVKIETCHQK